MIIENYTIIYIYSKDEYEGKFDKVQNTDRQNSEIYSRIHILDLANRLGYEYCIIAEDDISSLKFRPVINNKLVTANITNLDELFDSWYEFINCSSIITSIGVNEQMPYIGGATSKLYNERLIPEYVHMFMHRTDVATPYRGLVNDDAHYLVDNALSGNLCLAHTLIMDSSKQRDLSPGGLFDLYKTLGAFDCNCFTLCIFPSAVSFSYDGQQLRSQFRRRQLIPKLLSSKYKKTTY